MDERALRVACHVAFAWLVVISGLLWTFDTTSWSRRAELTVLGLTLEVGGLAFVSLDFWAPWLRETWKRLRVRQRLTRAGAVAQSTAARLLQRPRTAARMSQLAVEVVVSNPPTPLPMTEELSSAEVAQRLHDHQERIRNLEYEQAQSVNEHRRELDDLARDVRDMIRRSKDEYLGWRIVGLGLALAGTAVLSAANLVSP